MSRKSIQELAVERRELKIQIGADVRFVHNESGGHYIVTDVVFMQKEQIWGYQYVPAGVSEPVPFIRSIEIFKSRFRPYKASEEGA